MSTWNNLANLQTTTHWGLWTKQGAATMANDARNTASVHHGVGSLGFPCKKSKSTP